MEKSLSPATACSLSQGKNQQQFLPEPRELLPTQTTPPSKRTSRQEFSFVVRLSKIERSTIDNLSQDFGESLVTIFTKSIRLYRAIAEAADQGGSLIMRTDKSSCSADVEDVSHQFASPSEQEIQKLNSRKSFVVSVPIGGLPFGNDDLDGPNPQTALDFFPENQIDSNINKPLFLDINEAIIAVRDQFADNNLTPISLNPRYIAAPKGWKTEKVTFRTDASFANRLKILETKTGLKKSVIVRNAVQLYDFVKRKFQNKNISLYIGNTPITAI
jgi:hypothetical protein